MFRRFLFNVEIFDEKFLVENYWIRSYFDGLASFHSGADYQHAGSAKGKDLWFSKLFMFKNSCHEFLILLRAHVPIV